ncbi:hypothetical protein BDB00DRAFT_774685, partial [Zychaea mexicana]|uniref:uncharacterized protein n=1 Tax=Zychaea mexicana TaxID=64656 RepID=UPI0022FF0D97
TTTPVLAKVQSFLPQMQSANEQLTKQDTSKLDIENVEDDQEQYIEMNLGLGVFEQKKNKGGGSSSDSEQEDNDDAMNGSDDDDDDEDDIVIPSNTAQPKEKPNIQMLSESPKEK